MADEHQRQSFYTIGIAGHIDHGKTTLTKALTGKDTDRLKEEKERSISIELGFASFSLSSGQQVGVVDVPGHERFIRQMVAGVAGIDVVLMVIAADEGVMPQTREHLDILQLLGIRKGIIVLTKADRVDQEFLELVRESVMEEVEGTFLQDAPMIEVDSIRGTGIEQLKQEIERFIATIKPRSTQGITRLPIDSAFSKKGFGTVVTGTLYQGRIALGDELEVLPQQKKVKVRHIQVHEHSLEHAYAGQRVALNLSDIRVQDLERGHVLATKQALESTKRLDIAFHMLDHLDFSLKQRSPIRLHIGTSEIMGRIIFFDRNECLPGDTCLAQLELQEPITALFEDRFIIRRPTPMTTLGGGSVIDPYPSKHRFGAQTIEKLTAKQEGNLTKRATNLLHQQGILPLRDILHHLGVTHEEWLEQTKDSGEELKWIQGDSERASLVTTPALWSTTWSAITEELQQYHKRYPLRDGMDRIYIQQRYFPSVTQQQWSIILKEAVQEKRIRLQQEYLADNSFIPQLSERDRHIWEEIQQQMAKKPIEVAEWKELIPANMPQDKSMDLRKWLLRHAYLIEMEPDRYLSYSLFQQLLHQLQQHTTSSFTIQEARDIFQTTRKYLIPFLELLDQLQYTARKDQEREWITKQAVRKDKSVER